MDSSEQQTIWANGKSSYPNRNGGGLARQPILPGAAGMLGRRAFLAASATTIAASAIPVTGLAQQYSNPEVSLKMIDRYFRTLVKATASFRQTNFDGSWATGKVYLHRPWRLRLDYDPPAKLLLMAAGRRIFIFDLKSNTGPEEYPLSWTPFYPLLAKDIRLDRSKMVSGHFGNENITWINLSDPEGASSDYVTVVFRNEPLELAGWEYHSSDGTTTTLVVSDLKIVNQLPPNLFSPELEKRRHY